MSETASPSPPVVAYWQPGCTSCLRMKEFLTRHGVAFVSVNVLEDAQAFADLARLGARSVPVCRRGDDWANGQVLREVARVAGIGWDGAAMLPPAELARRVTLIQQAAQRLLAQMPEAALDALLPNRPRSYRQLFFHIFNILDAWLEHEIDGVPLAEGAYARVPPPQMKTGQDLAAYGRGVLARFEQWWEKTGAGSDFAALANVYYGAQTRHEFLERTAWHAGQHVRQLVLMFETRLGIVPDGAPGPGVFAGLPMPEKIWDDEPGAPDSRAD